MMDDLLSTPLARTGPTSRLLARQSLQPQLDSSLRMLDSALGSPIHRQTEDVSRLLDITRPTDFSRLATRGDLTLGGQDMELTRPLGADVTAWLGEEAPGVAHTQELFTDFLATVSSAESGAAALDIIAEFEQVVGDHCCIMDRLVKKMSGSQARQRFPKTITVREGLTNERNTWRLLGKLYTDRLVTSSKEPELPDPSPGSERQVIERLFARSPSVRQAWIVVEWLERNAQDHMEELLMQEMQYFADSSVGWENTLDALERGVGGPNMVTSMDPDANIRTGKQLHSLDQDDEGRLLKALFIMVRCGLLEEGQELCAKVGQPWRAATLEGWRLYHDPNFASGTGGEGGGKLPTEGNANRDIWKLVAWNLTEDTGLSQHERAVYAALCGNLSCLQGVCSSWEDLVWAGARVATDLAVETEMREVMVKDWVALPPQYWNSPASLSKVFQEVVGRGRGVAREAESPYHVIQRHLILDTWPELVRVMAGWGEEMLDPHLLRLMAHLVLVHRALGLTGDRAGEDSILTAFTQHLMDTEKLSLVPWYVARLPASSQVSTLAPFLTSVTNTEDQRLMLVLGREAGLDMDSVTQEVVRLSRETGQGEALVTSLAWLGLDLDTQAGALVTHTNTAVRLLLLQGEATRAREAMGMVPRLLLESKAREWREGEAGDDSQVREHLAHHTYLAALESFNDWFHHFHSAKPQTPQQPEGASFTEKVAHEQRMVVYQAELERWRGGQRVQARQAEEKIRAVLAFPGGWLLTQEEGDGEGGRQEQLSSLRQELVPRCVLMLHSVLHSTAQYTRALQLADTVAGEAVLGAFTKDSIRDILAKLRESSIAAMDLGKDAWGYEKQ